MSAELGTIEAVYALLDSEREAFLTRRRAVADAQRDQVVSAISQTSRTIEGERRSREWLTTPLEVPDWVDGLGWPEPDGPSPGPYDCTACEALFGPVAWGVVADVHRERF
jgi:hypothetical protein